MTRRFRDRAGDPLVAWATLTTLVVSAFFFLLMVGPANPFQEYTAGAVTKVFRTTVRIGQ